MAEYGGFDRSESTTSCSGSTTFQYYHSPPQKTKLTPNSVQFYKFPCNYTLSSTTGRQLLPNTPSSSSVTSISSNSEKLQKCAPRGNLSAPRSKERYLHKKSSTPRHCYPSACCPNSSTIRTSNASGLDPKSALAKRHAYSAQPKGNSDALPRKSREYFLHRNQSYTWRRVRLMREIKSYLGTPLVVSPQYNLIWYKDVRPHSQIQQDGRPGDEKN